MTAACAGPLANNQANVKSRASSSADCLTPHAAQYRRQRAISGERHEDKATRRQEISADDTRYPTALRVQRPASRCARP